MLDIEVLGFFIFYFGKCFLYVFVYMLRNFLNFSKKMIFDYAKMQLKIEYT